MRIEAQKPTESQISPSDIIVSQSTEDERIYSVDVPAYLDGSCGGKDEFARLSENFKVAARRPHLLIIHGFYEEEAKIIFEKAKNLRDTDVVLTTPNENICNYFISHVPCAIACFVVPNVGRDIFPFLLALRNLDIDHYKTFIKLHTKRSLHVADAGAWFLVNLLSFIGSNEVTKQLYELADQNVTSLYGLETFKITDHYINNQPWLSWLIGSDYSSSDVKFIPGSMFLGTGFFLRSVASRELWRYRFDGENGQLDGTLAHAMERYFGVIAEEGGGSCETLMELIAAKDER
ncbi:rhamnan synthesis F family protein [Cohaesibacter sp. ES.047]|uniref:rhamnan synthesis F family protein n=1 Tax=Cohaesibacter sp. ES.047 TaxID=1798205 RepID=UPI0012FE3279|nr:rhamnan synthesis F family protein [Cohaesibacter sp. ES.047]